MKGSADGLFPPGISHFSDSIQFFSTDLCRPLTFSKSGEDSLHGISVTTFDLSVDNFANSSVCPDNKCYNNNIPSGVQVSNDKTLTNQHIAIHESIKKVKLPSVLIRAGRCPKAYIHVDKVRRSRSGGNLSLPGCLSVTPSSIQSC